jgi:hypothetical protein
LAGKTLELLPGRPIEEEHVEDLLGPARPPRTSTNLAGRRAEQQEGLREE